MQRLATFTLSDLILCDRMPKIITGNSSEALVQKLCRKGTLPVERCKLLGKIVDGYTLLPVEEALIKLIETKKLINFALSELKTGGEGNEDLQQYSLVLLLNLGQTEASSERLVLLYPELLNCVIKTTALPEEFLVTEAWSVLKNLSRSASVAEVMLSPPCNVLENGMKALKALPYERARIQILNVLHNVFFIESAVSSFLANGHYISTLISVLRFGTVKLQIKTISCICQLASTMPALFVVSTVLMKEVLALVHTCQSPELKSSALNIILKLTVVRTLDACRPVIENEVLITRLVSICKKPDNEDVFNIAIMTLVNISSIEQVAKKLASRVDIQELCVEDKHAGYFHTMLVANVRDPKGIQAIEGNMTRITEVVDAVFSQIYGTTYMDFFFDLDEVLRTVRYLSDSAVIRRDLMKKQDRFVSLLVLSGEIAKEADDEVSLELLFACIANFALEGSMRCILNDAGLDDLIQYGLDCDEENVKKQAIAADCNLKL